jgi:hypothetical protein
METFLFRKRIQQPTQDSHLAFGCAGGPKSAVVK